MPNGIVGVSTWLALDVAHGQALLFYLDQRADPTGTRVGTQNFLVYGLLTSRRDISMAVELFWTMIQPAHSETTIWVSRGWEAIKVWELSSALLINSNFRKGQKSKKKDVVKKCLTREGEGGGGG